MIAAFRQRFAGLAQSIARYPLTIALLILTAVLTSLSIAGTEHLENTILAGAIGAAACAAARASYERFFTGVPWLILLNAAGLVIAGLFYLSIMGLSDFGAQTGTRTVVMMFALITGYIWLPTIKSRYHFGESFMAAFKALFQAGFFSGVIFLGCAAIIAAFDQLITPVDSDVYGHTASIVFIVIAPLFFLSLIPVYPGKVQSTEELGDAAGEELVRKRTSCPKFLDVLLSYIIIPLASVFTVILLVYILLNLSGRFWTDNLLEPMLIAYTAVVIVVTILVGNLENRFAVLFRKIFPKVLIPIALFQVIASCLLLTDKGVTFGRYYVILYGVFAVFSGVVLSIRPPRKSGIIALALILLSAISLIPPVDAFTVSRNSQISSMESVLVKNGMLDGQTVRPNGNISDEDKTTIITSIQYLSETDELRYVKWLPADYDRYDDNDFYTTFGFHQYIVSEPGYEWVNVGYIMTDAIPVTGYDVVTQLSIPDYKVGNTGEVAFNTDGKAGTILTERSGNGYQIVVRDDGGRELIRFDTIAIPERYSSFKAEKALLTSDEATFTAESIDAALKIIVINAGFRTVQGYTDLNMQLFVLIRIK